MTGIDDSLAAINAGLAQGAPDIGAAQPAPAQPSSIDRSLNLLQGALSQPLPSPAAPAPPVARPSVPIGAAARLGEGFTDALAAGVQGTSPVVGTAAGASNYQAAPSQDQWVFQETGRVPNEQTQVALRNPQTGQYQVYQRNPAMAEGAAPAVGRMLAYGTPESGIPAVAAPQSIMAPRALAQDFAQTGIAPNVPVLAQGPLSGYAASIMSKLPGFSGPIVHGTQNMASQTQAAVDRAAAGLGTASIPEDAGEAIQKGVQSFAKAPAPVGMSASDIISSPTRASSFAAKSNALYDHFWSQMAPNAQVPLTNTLAALKGPMGRFPTAPELGAAITNPKLNNYYGILSSGGTLTVPELQEFRSYIGRALGEPALINDIPRADLSRVYAGMSQDLGNAAQAQGPQAARAFQAANSYYKAGQQRIDQLEPLLNGSPEQAFAKINRAAGEGPAANAGLLRSLQRSLSPDDWGSVGATVLSRMGEPTAGTAHATDFSPATFVTNWNKLSDAAKDTLYGAQGSPVRDNIEALTRVAGAQKNMTRFANPSGTAHMGYAAAEGSLALTAIENREAFLMHPIATTMAIAGGYAAPRMLMNPSVARWLYQVPAIVNRSPTASAGIQRALGGLDLVARGNPDLEPIAAQLHKSLEPVGVQ